METSYKEYYKEQLSEAQEYQDFCVDVFIRELGISITNYQSAKYQFRGGENPQGIEIKHDKKFNDTGNLYIEIGEKSDPERPEFVRSGIYRNDNSWLYSIGDYNTIYIFSKSLLQHLYEADKFREVKTQTSVGYLLPLADANKYCAKKIIIK
jgi:hypothetical protein